MRIRIAMMLMLSIFATTSLQSAAYSDETIKEPHSSDQIIVTYKDGTSSAEAIDAERRVSTRSTKPLHRDARSRTDVLQVGPGISVESAIVTLRNDPNVLYAEPNYLLHKAVPNDPYYTTGSQLWGMYGDTTSPSNSFGSQAAEAWAAGYTGSSTVVVGVIDEGIQITHPDLSTNIWVNPDETPNNGVDDDGNNYIDDINGWDFFNNDKTVFDGTTDATIDAHGTHVSGTIGAVGNNGLGVAGVNWNVEIVSAKFLGPRGGSTSDAVLAIDYLVNLKKTNGVNLVAINNSWGGGGFSQTMEDAINRAGDQGIFFVAAAGNGDKAGNGLNNDITNSYPSNYQCTKTAAGALRNWDCVVAVASITSTGNLSTFSNYGPTTVDIGAPGSAIISTIPNNLYASYSGTSMATPHVTGAIALCVSVNPGITPAQIRSALMSSAAPTNSLRGMVMTGGRLDVSKLIDACLQAQDPLVISNTVLSGVAGTAIALSTTGGSGGGAITFSTTGIGCSIVNDAVIASQATSCAVTATKAASGIYAVATSAPVTFNFTLDLQGQDSLVISNTVLSGVAGTAIALSTTGGSGGGAITFSTTGIGCSIVNDAVIASQATSCAVTATKAASGIYAVATSAPVTFSFTSAEVPNIIVNPPISVTPQLQTQTFKALPLSMKKNRTFKISAKTSQGNYLQVKVSGMCKVTKIYTYKNKKKVLSKFAIKAKSKKGNCKVRISAPALSGYSSIDEVKSIKVK